MPIRSSELNRSRASCFEMPIVFAAYAFKPILLLSRFSGCRSADCRASKLQRLVSRDDPESGSFLVVQTQAVEIFLFQAEMNVLDQVSLKFTRRHIEFYGGSLADFAYALDAILLRCVKIGDHFRRHRFRPAGPDRQHAGLAG